MQIVAFPQSRVMRCPGVLDLLDAAVRNGADLVGGIDPLEIDRDPKGQLDGIFAIAARHGVGLDIHLHEPGEMGLFNVQEICARTKTLGLGGKVTISHGFCLGGVTERKAAEAAQTMAEAGVALVTHGAGGLTMPPLEMLRGAGVLVFAGNDDIRDTWSPYGTGDLPGGGRLRPGHCRWRAGPGHRRLRHHGRRRGQSLHYRRRLRRRSSRRSSVAQARTIRRTDCRPRRRFPGRTGTDRKRGINRSWR